MKIVTRTLIVLFAALLVAGATIALGQSSLGAALAPAGRPQLQQAEGDAAGEAATGRPMGERPGGGEGRAGVSGLVAVGKSLATIAAVVLLTGAAGWLGRRLRAARAPLRP